MPGDTIRVVLADDHTVVRAGLRAVLGTAKDITVVGEAATGREAVALVERLTPDVLITDAGLEAEARALLGQQARRLIVAEPVDAAAPVDDDD